MSELAKTAGMKIANTVAIYSTLRKYGRQTKRDLSARTSLSFSSVSNLANSLTEKGMVRQVDTDTMTGGRTAQIVEINPEYAYSLVVDLHNTRVVYLGLANMMNAVEKTLSFRIAEDETFTSLMRKLTSNAFQLMAGVKAPILGVCVGISATQTDSMIIHSNIPFLEGVNLKRYLQGVFEGKSVIVENDANLCALSQVSGAENLLFIMADEGVGLGICIDGKLYRGAKGFAGEFGHMKVTGVEKKCSCGAIGCLRLVARLNSIAEDLGETEDYLKAPSPQVYAHSLRLRYEAHDEQVVKRVDLAAEKLGEACASLYDVFNPEQIIVGGNMGDLFSCISPVLWGSCRKYSHLATITDMRIKVLEDPVQDILMKGAGERVFQEMWDSPFWIA